MSAPDLFSTLPPAAASAAPAREPAAGCATCGARPAPFGFGVALRKGRTGVWYCRAHRPGGA